MPEVKQRKRRSKRAVAREKAAKEARRIERAQRAAEKLAAWEAGYPERAKRYQQEHDARLEHERTREGQRRIQEAGIAYIMGYDTHDARWFAKYVKSHDASVANMNRRAAAAGDPLKLMSAAPPLSKKKKKEAQRQAERDRVARGEFKEVIPDLDNPKQNVVVTALAHSFRRMKRKLATHQQAAAERFLLDWEAAEYSGLSSLGFDPRVDSSPTSSTGLPRAAEARARLQMAKKHIGQRNYDICIGVLIFNRSASDIHALGGRDHRTVNNDIDIALNALSGFYDPVRLARDPTWRAFQKVIEIGLGVIEQGEEETR